jgi:hypothetical protein
MQLATSLPASTVRLLAHYNTGELELPEHRVFLIGRIFEEGDTEDLRWLTANICEEDLLGWLRSYGCRQLSKRSLAFWAAVLGDGGITDKRPTEIEELWPL